MEADPGHMVGMGWVWGGYGVGTRPTRSGMSAGDGVSASQDGVLPHASCASDSHASSERRRSMGPPRL